MRRAAWSVGGPLLPSCCWRRQPGATAPSTRAPGGGALDVCAAASNPPPPTPSCLAKARRLQRRGRGAPFPLQYCQRWAVLRMARAPSPLRGVMLPQSNTRGAGRGRGAGPRARRAAPGARPAPGLEKARGRSTVLHAWGPPPPRCSSGDDAWQQDRAGRSRWAPPVGGARG
jgi:hypothetical protein